MTPRGRRRSGTRRRILIEDRVELLAQTFEPWSSGEGGHGGIGGDEAAPLERRELADWDAVSGHDEGFAAVQGTHDLATAVAELALGDLTTHGALVARVLRALALSVEFLFASDAVAR